jgi:hypothetical protein
MDRTMTMNDADRPDRLALDEHEFALTSAELTVTRLPWGELSLHMEALGTSDHNWLSSCAARLEGVRARGTGRPDLDGLVIETAQGWYPDPDETNNAIIATHSIYYGAHDELLQNRVELRRIDDDHVRVLWTGTTTMHWDNYCRADLNSKLVVDVRAVVKDGEYQRVIGTRSEGLGDVRDSRVDAAVREIWDWKKVRGRELDAAGYFEGRSFARVDFVLVYTAVVRAPRMQVRPDRTLRVTVDVPIAVARSRPGELADVIKATMNAALDEVARAYPAAPSYLR